MEVAELARWTPIRFDFSRSTPTVLWADLTAERFVDPFFDETVARCLSGPHARPLVRTGLDALVALDSEPSLELAGKIFHLSRCGSTLVSGLLRAVPGVVVLSEPAPLNALLRLAPDRLEEATLVRLVRVLLRALGRRRHDDERQLVLKCTSWNVRRRAVLAAAFPETPWIWVQREPVRILASLFVEPPGWLGLQGRPHQAGRLFGLDPAAVPEMSRVEFAARVLGAMLDAAIPDPRLRLLIDYAELPSAVWQRAALHFRLPVDDAAIERMIEESRFYSKDRASGIFTGDDSQRRPVTDEMRAAAGRFAAPGYRALAPYA
jgi:hypothetical protein